MQSSEKAYKVAEEVVKALAEKYNTQEYQQSLKEGDGILTYCAKLLIP